MVLSVNYYKLPHVISLESALVGTFENDHIRQCYRSSMLNQCRCLLICISHPVTKNARACVRGLDVSDEGDMLQFGEEEQQQTLQSDG